MGNAPQTQQARRSEHAGPFYQTYSNRLDDHGGAFVPSQPRQQYHNQQNDHGGAFVPAQPQQQYHNRQNDHGGAFVPSQPQQQYHNRQNDHNGALGQARAGPYRPDVPPQPGMARSPVGGGHLPMHQQNPSGPSKGTLPVRSSVHQLGNSVANWGNNRHLALTSRAERVPQEDILPSRE